MIESQMDHAIGLRRAAAQAVEILQIAAMHLRARGPQRRRAFIRARQTQHAVPCSDQLLNHRCSDKAGRARYKYSHQTSSLMDGGHLSAAMLFW